MDWIRIAKNVEIDELRKYFKIDGSGGSGGVEGDLEDVQKSSVLGLGGAEGLRVRFSGLFDFLLNSPLVEIRKILKGGKGAVYEVIESVVSNLVEKRFEVVLGYLKTRSVDLNMDLGLTAGLCFSKLITVFLGSVEGGETLGISEDVFFRAILENMFFFKNQNSDQKAPERKDGAAKGIKLSSKDKSSLLRLIPKSPNFENFFLGFFHQKMNSGTQSEPNNAQTVALLQYLIKSTIDTSQYIRVAKLVIYLIKTTKNESFKLSRIFNAAQFHRFLKRFNLDFFDGIYGKMISEYLKELSYNSEGDHGVKEAKLGDLGAIFRDVFKAYGNQHLSLKFSKDNHNCKFYPPSEVNGGIFLSNLHSSAQFYLIFEKLFILGFANFLARFHYHRTDLRRAGSE